MRNIYTYSIYIYILYIYYIYILYIIYIYIIYIYFIYARRYTLVGSHKVHVLARHMVKLHWIRRTYDSCWDSQPFANRKPPTKRALYIWQTRRKNGPLLVVLARFTWPQWAGPCTDATRLPICFCYLWIWLESSTVMHCRHCCHWNTLIVVVVMQAYVMDMHVWLFFEEGNTLLRSLPGLYSLYVPF